MPFIVGGHLFPADRLRTQGLPFRCRLFPGLFPCRLPGSSSLLCPRLRQRQLLAGSSLRLRRLLLGFLLVRHGRSLAPVHACCKTARSRLLTKKIASPRGGNKLALELLGNLRCRSSSPAGGAMTGTCDEASRTPCCSLAGASAWASA